MNRNKPWPMMPQAGTGPESRILMQAASFSVVGEKADKLLKDYNRHLIEDLGMMRRRDVKAKDIVDLRPVLRLDGLPGWQAPDPGLDFQDRLYVAQDYYYCYIPCFEEGVYHVNSGRYIYWKVADMDLARHRMMLWLQDFVYYDEGSGWQPGIHGNVAWRFEDPDTAIQEAFSSHRPMKCEYAATDDAVTDYVKMYQVLDVRSLGWSKADVADWEHYVMAYARKGCAMMRQKTGSHNLDSLTAMFTSYTVKTNRMLSEHKESRKSAPVSEKEHGEYLKAKAEAKAAGTKPAPERRVRVVGPISVTSRAKPKPGRRAAANYTKASWETRGHMRTLKSGRKVWVKKSVHRRKALQGAAGAPEGPSRTPLTIRLETGGKNGKKEEGGKDAPGDT